MAKIDPRSALIGFLLCALTCLAVYNLLGPGTPQAQAQRRAQQPPPPMQDVQPHQFGRYQISACYDARYQRAGLFIADQQSGDLYSHFDTTVTTMEGKVWRTLYLGNLADIVAKAERHR